jgi:hypothetical protein
MHVWPRYTFRKKIKPNDTDLKCPTYPETFKVDYLGDSWMRTSLMSCWCFSTFLVFMILTMAA